MLWKSPGWVRWFGAWSVHLSARVVTCPWSRKGWERLAPWQGHRALLPVRSLHLPWEVSGTGSKLNTQLRAGRDEGRV